MRALTIKVDGGLLASLEEEKPPGETLTSFVRTLLENELRRSKMARAAAQYADFLGDNRNERAWLSEWNSADLATPALGKRH